MKSKFKNNYTAIHQKIISLLLAVAILFGSNFIFSTSTAKVQAATVSNDLEVTRLTTEVNNDTITERIAIKLKDDSVSANNNSSVSAPIIYLNVSISGDSVGTIKGTITCIGGRPNNTSINMSLQSRETRRSFTTKSSKNNLNFSYYKTISSTASTNNKTRVWRVYLTGKFLGNNLSYSTNYFLFNKKAMRYPSYYEPYSGKKLWEPPTYLYADTTQRDPSFRSKYINNFKKTYPKSNINWSNHEIHHMQPLKYSGSNALSNGIALTKVQHKTVTKWWLYY